MADETIHIQQPNDFATHFAMVMIFLVILSVGCGVTGFCCYKVGKANGKLEGTLNAWKIAPPTTITGSGTQINYNVTPKPRFAVRVWPLCMGWGCV